ncbi:RNA polymerase II subunit A C-terminal domain phosphatase [Cyberlindnera fabianii]|uniref:RNA polymerase II subunit A C-terminal domain phosphatase n=1 Tax=Cyberlindnera fabianii TaxID=36022 RepID=A0A1V2LFB8_CYBFA|nr:RNA polymerase II subunit A C-terminal domain phosphatase [Cyberlindnera fabianii]
MSSLTPLTLPKSAPYPVKISAIHVQRGQQVAKHEPLVTYTYWEFQDSPDSPKNGDYDDDRDEKSFKPKKVRVDLIGTFESPINGVIEEICVQKGDEILGPDTEIAKVLEPCTHSIQYGGLCALCGKSVEDDKDYSGYQYEDRAPISMSHGTSNLKVSKDEAEKVEEKWQKGLISEKKLILVVDLDQTVIHATVDPTIGEWMKDESNPNYPSLKDVKSFELEEDVVISPSYKGPRPPPFSRTYYVKLRPGLQQFLERIAEKYELHIYTMGTRSYAKSIAHCIDPEGKYFADRILSRDESGSMTTKSLERLFPTDRSMVVIIDDRGDVWNWSDHLVKVVPFDFFVGIGDINSKFLPKQKSLLGPTKRRESIAKLEETLIEDEAERSDELAANAKTATSSDGDKLPETQDQGQLAAEPTEREATLEAQTEQRPMEKLQKDLDALAAHRERLLYDDDDELQGLEKALLDIHAKFYATLEENPKDPPHIENILPSMKKRIFEGLQFVFSGLLPLGGNMNNESIVIWVRTFGADVSSEVTMETTHIIAKNPYTFKAKLGKTMVPGCKIMHPDWLFDSMTNWRIADDAKYEVEFAADKYLSEEEAVATPGDSQGGDLLGGDMEWLNEEDEEDESFDSSDSDDDEEAENGLKRGADDDNNSVDDGEESTKRRKLGDSSVEEEDEDDDDFAAELMQDLDDD